MGAGCSAVPHDSVSAPLPQRQPIQVRAAGSSVAAAAAASNDDAPLELMWTPPAGAAHLFGLSLTPPELAALSPERAVPVVLTAKEQLLWTTHILPSPKTFITSRPREWNAILISQRIPPEHRVALWAAALDIDLDGAHSPVARAGPVLPYSEYLLSPSPADSQISRDVYRTFPSTRFFSHRPVQRTVGRILHAWSLYHPVVSYVQGHNFLAALFLLVCLDEERAFRLFVAFLTHESKGMEAFYADGLALLMSSCEELGGMVRSVAPDLGAHLSTVGLDTLVWATPLYLTAFTHHLPLDRCIYVGDFLLLANLSHRQLPPLPAAAASAVVPRSGIADAITHLTLAMLLEQKRALLKCKGVEPTFRLIQELAILKDDKSRRKVFERALSP